MSSADRLPRFPWPSLLTLGVLTGVMVFHLLGALLAGLLVHQLVHHLARRWHTVGDGRARWLAAATLTGVIILVVTLAILGLVSYLGDGAHLGALSDTMTQTLTQLRTELPGWLGQTLPTPDTFKHSLMGLAREHSTSLQTMGQHTLEALVHVFLGLVLGGMIALAGTHANGEEGPLPQIIRLQATQVANAFDRVVFAQLKISVVNTLLTGLFLLVALPLLGTGVPFAKTLVLLTFIFGLLPVLGNLISNTLIVLVALSVSPGLGAVALGFLIVVHKLEYFLNARIVGSEIQAKAWEILLAMVVMEALFGFAGVVLAPIVYAYLKADLRRQGWLTREAPVSGVSEGADTEK